MARRHYRRPRWVHKIVLLALPLLIVGAVYAAQTQSLNIVTRTVKPGYNIQHGMTMTYEIGEPVQVSIFTDFPIALTIVNNGPVPVESIEIELYGVNFNGIACDPSLLCTYDQQLSQLYIRNNAINRFIQPGNSYVYNMTIRNSSTDRPLFDHISISGIQNNPLTTIPGLSTTHSMGARSKSGRNWVWPVTFTVSNDTGASLSFWELSIGWSVNEGVVSFPPDVTYVVEGNTLMVSRLATFPDSSSYQFTATLHPLTTSGSRRTLPEGSIDDPSATCLDRLASLDTNGFGALSVNLESDTPINTSG
ncbi:hypothetical protein B7Y94_02205 [Candidatus Saccharibacteria bacterium 32-49-12]|nr:MAG: hypothetical protein B7Y94_02205 [Candidatus Saccharibacteria bacterium 32-49-12]